MFGLSRSSDLVKWSFKGLIITTDSIKGPVINAKEQRSGMILTLKYVLFDLATYLRASKGRRKPHWGDSVFIKNEGEPLQVNDINSIVLSTLSSSGIDTRKFKSHSIRSAMASLLLFNNVPFHVVKKMGRWKSNDTVDTFYDKRIIGEKSGGIFIDTVNEQSDDESSNNVDVPTDYQLSDTLLGQYKHMVNNQGLLVKEECILKKDEISELNKIFNFPSNIQVNVAPFGTPEGITVSFNVKNNDTD
ncbi:hypothetical protein DDB_G0294310 [Dictyostelium discoideum AX4]|uniref:Tyr recombinase domain-containing protein n=1 Tax=Dictyostelium discoideum TaxID=44689 RepID=Q54AP1_DICDI|nr:hypothetical protein DDB_G0294310 [Dictyostelium discoideum AX4]EAL60328.1 hypothetical protein DDB_G0294310 [Dictyostelium discoideum AX4]|eukprot:XP_628741.1 hypothetical protein DDB_G0294310 [Dictyostelium discoideum AX4]